LAFCGDGFTQAGVEECDDGNDDETDACIPVFCTDAVCGDGFVWEGSEDCDDGNQDDNDDCPTTCDAPVCGDGYVQAGVEECDDGDQDDTDDCPTTCENATCGDGFEWSGNEECDDGDQDDTDDCPTSCTDAVCGDGFLWQGQEECDDGNEDEFDGCLTTCATSLCGNGQVDQGEDCDDNNGDLSDACPVCQDAFCGDGYKWQGQEECDDGNNVDDDACTNGCLSNIIPATCNELITNMNMFGAAATGFDLRARTASTLHWMGCMGNGCNPNDWYCIYEPNNERLEFGSNGGVPRSAVDPGNNQGDTMPNNFNGCCSGPLGLCNTPDSANNGVNITMIDALCRALGYAGGTLLAEQGGNVCPEPHVNDVDGLDWDSDFVNSAGYGEKYECQGFL
jgi:cysteine-rich repeat protein